MSRETASTFESRDADGQINLYVRFLPVARTFAFSTVGIAMLNARECTALVSWMAETVRANAEAHTEARTETR